MKTTHELLIADRLAPKYTKNTHFLLIFLGRSPTILRDDPSRLVSRLAVLAAFVLLPAIGRAQTSRPIVPTAPDSVATPALQAVRIRTIKKFYRQLLLKEKNVAAAVSHVGTAAILQAGVQGSIQSVLTATPSVNVYQENFGEGVPVITIRGVRNSELAQTLDGIPLQDLLYGGGGERTYGTLGSPVTLGQISGVDIYPGVAPPDRQGFATIGGTIAYTTKKPGLKESAEVFAGYGSYNTSKFGFELNTGAMGSSPDAPRALLRYSHLYTDGYIDNTNARYDSMLFSLVKPYDEGLDHLTATVIYNRGYGYQTNFPAPVTLSQEYGPQFNFSKNQAYATENDRFLTAILGDETYINPHLILKAKLFVLHNASTVEQEENPALVVSSYNPAFPYQITFGAPYYSYPAVGPGTNFYQPGYFTYDPVTTFGSDTAGLSAQNTLTHSTTIGFVPKANIFLPHNDITVGALIAKESGSQSQYFYGADPMPEINGYNSSEFGGGSQRTVYSMFVQDKINLLDDKLHIEPGADLTGVYTSNIVTEPVFHTASKLQNYSKIVEPYLGISYDLPNHMVAYASYGKGARFAPVSYYSTGAGPSTTTAPNPAIIHSYEVGLRYDTPRLYLNLDGFYQKVNDLFGLYLDYNDNLFQFSNDGVEQFKGIEASGKFRLTPHVELFGNASYNQANYLSSFDTQLTPYEGQFGYAFKGQPVTSVPAWLGNFGVTYTRGPWLTRFTGHYTGQQYTTFSFTGGDTQPIPGSNPPGTFALQTVPYANPIPGNPVQHFLLPGFLTLNAYAAYKIPVHFGRLRALKVSINAQNLLGLDYFSHFYGFVEEIASNTTASGYVNTSPYNAAYYGPPRSVFLDVSAKF